MTIYLACTVRGDRSGVAAGRAICERLQHHGHEVLTTHLLADNVESAEAQISEAEVFKRDIEWLTGCDLLVAEASGSSYGVGFEVGYVLGRAARSGQRVVLLYNRGRQQAISRLITGNSDPACTTFGYDSLEQLTDFIDRQLPATRQPRTSKEHERNEE
jgi:NAD(P)-dependent dehydrogenase (short-subunit alcohol dehydrogenase family)